MTVDQLADEPFGHVVDVPPAVIRGDLRVERHLQQQIAELVSNCPVVVGVDRRQELVRLLQEMASERSMRLLAIPRAAVGLAESRLHLHQLEEPLTTLG